MQFKLFPEKISLSVRIAVLSIAWIIIISLLHYCLNLYESKRNIINIGYMPVISNLSAPLPDYASRDGEGIRFKSLKFSSFAEMAEALRNDQIHAAFMIAPLSIVLRQQGSNVKVVYIGNRHESTLVATKGLNATSLVDLEGKTIAIPMRYSGHNIALLRQLGRQGLSGRIKIVEMNPPDMASALASDTLDAYFVGEPFAAQTLKSGDSSLVFYVEDVWKDFICNILITKQSIIDKDPDSIKALVQSAARAGIWAQDNLDESAEVASQYWNQPVDLIKYALNNPKHRVVFDRFVPKQDEMQYLADQMVKFDLLTDNNISGLTYDKFAKETKFNDITDINSIIAPFSK